MTDTTAATGLVVQQWEDKFFSQYLHDGGFKPLMGTGENAVIQVKEDLSKKAGDSITIALVNRLNNAAVTGSSTLEGSEEDLVSRSMRIHVDKRRNAVRVSEMNEQKSAISLRQAARPTDDIQVGVRRRVERPGTDGTPRCIHERRPYQRTVSP